MKTTMQARIFFVLAVCGASAGLAQQPDTSALSVTPSVNIQVVPHVVQVGQVKDDLFSGTDKFAQGASDVTEVNLDPSMMGMVGKDGGKDGDIARKMDFMVIHSYKYDKPGMYNMSDVDALRKKLEDGSWSCSIHVRNARGSTDICSRAGSDHETNEMVILSAEPQKLTFIHMKGKMSLDQLDQMSGGAAGLKHHGAAPSSPPPPPPPQ
jgi:hypothetical protein